MANLGGLSMISEGRSQNGRGVRRLGGGNPRYNRQPRSLFSSDANTPTGYAADGTTLISGNSPSVVQPRKQPGSVTGLTPVHPRGYQAPNVLAMEPGVKTSTYAPNPLPKPGVTQNVRINLDQPAPTATTSKAAQTESSNPLTGDTNSQPTGKTTGLTPVSPVPTAAVSPSPDVDHARALGLSTKGNGTPTGDDIPAPGSDTGAQSDSFTGGTGQYQKSFGNPTSAAIYHDYVKKLFGGNVQDTDKATGYDNKGQLTNDQA